MTQVILTKNEIVKSLSARDHWDQLSQAQEDCAALIVAINKLRRNKNKNSAAYGELCDSVAATVIILSRCYLFLDSEKIDERIMLKLARAGERLKNGNF